MERACRVHFERTEGAYAGYALMIGGRGLVRERHVKMMCGNLEGKVQYTAGTTGTT